MVNQDESDQMEAIKQKSGQADALQNRLGNILNGMEKNLAVTCESIMDKMKHLEDKIQDMEKRYTQLVQDAEKSLKESEKVDDKTDDAGPSDKTKLSQ